MTDESLSSARPPVNEVVLSVAMQPQPALLGPGIPAILGDFFEEHREIKVAPPYRISPEPPEHFAAPSNFTAEIQFNPSVEPRYWLHSGDQSEVIQVQPDYLALNWRRGEGEREYVHYETLREKFVAILETARQGLLRSGGSLLPERAELTYVNIIAPNAVWASLAEVHKLFNVNVEKFGEYEQMSVLVSSLIMGVDRPIGRMHISLKPAHDWVKAEPQIHLAITLRSFTFDESTIEAALAFLDQAHEHANAKFRDLATPAALEAWGI
ncbi:TIGR04255 family protein [Streptomyces sp. NBC_00038]|uniref:TIGR04255 family protein n=1 Tax=Streptomyces sp. NBC_00038 TaxID=2903615 RepID=UPI0022596D01|nr:TIGR04255 family protein [Streptomyces sp. NBC_00038]MCX5560745.1 TIGR04255 family protein [Streptomyces sp. NBC_00038]